MIRKSIVNLNGTTIYIGYTRAELDIMRLSEHKLADMGTCEICKYNPAIVIWIGGKRYCSACRANAVTTGLKKGA